MKIVELIRGLNKFDVLIGYGNKRDWVSVQLPADDLQQIIDDVKSGNSSYLSSAFHAIYSSAGELRPERLEYKGVDDKDILHLNFFGNLDGQEIHGLIKLRVGMMLE